ncbi:hypothetical protein GP486_006825 [Trichoglossum hirsutum]|uniref:F-box domain-containing protein n=1 Tax=Trichoglossum hirsutum TaxID=265104 RepID=A0A9P8IGM3_9PEZI|nr:hypothetical protein GP486_006825 [Trichoglossum hirsutum]
MPSPSLTSLLRNQATGHRIFANLSTTDCLSLRLVSRVFRASVDATEGGRLFGILRVKRGRVSERMRKGLVGIGAFCGEVVVCVGSEEPISMERDGGGGQRAGKEKVGGLTRLLSRSNSRKRGPTPAATPPTTSISHWTFLFAHVPNLHTLTISSSNYSPAWTPTPRLDETLMALRSAFETANLPNIHTLRLHPMHPLGLLHLRWTVAFLDAGWIAGKLWSRITTLALHVLNPGRNGLSSDHQLMFAKILHSYLASFEESLVRLVFVWVGEVGVCPLTLETKGRRGRFSAPPLRMRGVRSLWLGNVGLRVEELEAMVRERMKGCEEVWVDGEVRGAVTGDVGWAVVESVWVSGKWVWKFGRLMDRRFEQHVEPWEGRGSGWEDGEDHDGDDMVEPYGSILDYYCTQKQEPQTDIERFQRLRNG